MGISAPMRYVIGMEEGLRIGERGWRRKGGGVRGNFGKRVWMRKEV